MKKLFLMFLTAGLILTLTANGQSDPWIKTDNGQVSCQKISIQAKNAKIVLENGEKATVPTSSIHSYFVDGKLYNKMPLYNKGVKSNDVFMELLNTRDDMTLYKYRDLGTVRYFVFKGEDIYQELVDGNTSGFEKFFNTQL